MANAVLFHSSLGMGLAHGLAMLLWSTWRADWWLTLVYAVGVLTSLVNHGLTSPVYKWSDRLWMALGCATDALYVQTSCRHGLERLALTALQVRSRHARGIPRAVKASQDRGPHLGHDVRPLRRSGDVHHRILRRQGAHPALGQEAPRQRAAPGHAPGRHAAALLAALPHLAPRATVSSLWSRRAPASASVVVTMATCLLASPSRSNP